MYQPAGGGEKFGFYLVFMGFLTCGDVKRGRGRLRRRQLLLKK
jgi:hypothetical protein